MKKIFVLALSMLIISGCSYNHKLLSASEKSRFSSLKGKTFYTLANIWFPELNKASSMNIHLKGSAILPAGTKVTMGEINNKCIYFSDEFGVVYMLRLNNKNSIDMITFFNRYFSEINPMQENGKFYQFTKQEQENIKLQTIDYGMSKEAILMSYGYPPAEKGLTPNLASNSWTYIENGKMKTVVYFKDNKVVKIEDAKLLFKKPFHKREQRFTERSSGGAPNTVHRKNSSADEILKYKKLLDSGAITKSEYEQKKQQLLDL